MNGYDIVSFFLMFLGAIFTSAAGYNTFSIKNYNVFSFFYETNNEIHLKNIKFIKL